MALKAVTYLFARLSAGKTMLYILLNLTVFVLKELSDERVEDAEQMIGTSPRDDVCASV